MTESFRSYPAYQQGVTELANEIDNGNPDTAAERFRTDYLQCVEMGMGKGQDGRARWNAIVEDTYNKEKEGKGWDMKLSDKNNDGILEVTLFDPNTGFSIYGERYCADRKVINRADDSKKSLVHHAESSADDNRKHPEMAK